MNYRSQKVCLCIAIIITKQSSSCCLFLISFFICFKVRNSRNSMNQMNKAGARGVRFVYFIEIQQFMYVFVFRMDELDYIRLSMPHE
jgi:hypothetical protein